VKAHVEKAGWLDEQYSRRQKRFHSDYSNLQPEMDAEAFDTFIKMQLSATEPSEDQESDCQNASMMNPPSRDRLRRRTV
jgi:hypothetical protein